VGDHSPFERVPRKFKDPPPARFSAAWPPLSARFKVTDVDDISAVAIAVSGTGFKVGDAVRTVTQ